MNTNRIHVARGSHRLALILAVVLFSFGAEPIGRAHLAEALSNPTQTAGNCGAMDVAFLVDDTGSMGGAINNVKSELASILTNIETASGGDYRLALVSFKDNITIRENFAAMNASSVGSKILSLFASGGAGSPEASDEALNTVVNALPASGRPQNIDFNPWFRNDVLRIAILVTDAPPGGFDDTYTPGVDDVHAHNIAVDAARAFVRVSAVFVPTGGDYSGQRAIMEDYAITTNGVFIETGGNGSGTGSAINDIIARCGVGVADSDGDGLNDEWETNGIPGVDLPGMGSDPNVKDIFVQVNWMEDGSRSQKPSPEAIEKVVRAFKDSGVDGGRGINLHVDVGPDSIDYVTGQQWGERGKGHAVPWKDVLGVDDSGNDVPLVDEANALLYDGSPRQLDTVFRHAYFVSKFKIDDEVGRSGLAFVNLGERDANGVPITNMQVFWVSLGTFWFGKGTTNEQAGTFMHELGHILGLDHGGGDEINQKPNYLGVMNYSFQMGGVIRDNDFGILTDGHYDYSHFSDSDLLVLHESELYEADGIGDPMRDGKKYGTKRVIFPPYDCKPWYKLGWPEENATVRDNAKPIDWDCDWLGGIDDEAVQADVNGEGGSLQELSSYDDWANTVFLGGNIGKPGSPLPLLITPEVVASAPIEITHEQDLRIQRIGEPRISLAKTVDPLAVNVGDTVTYTISLLNSDAGDAVDVFITDTLPPEFSYQSSSTSGTTTADPVIVGQSLTWGPLVVAGESTAQIVFRATTSDVPGDYRNTVSGSSTNGVVNGSTDTAPLKLMIRIDIKPGGSPNPINLNSAGNTPVAILSTPGFDASSQVDRTLVTFGKTGDEQSLVRCNRHGEDVNGDGLLDLVCAFRTRLTGFDPTSSEGILKAKVLNGAVVEGRDSIVIVP